MAFPSTLSTFNRPSPTDRLNSPSHSALHNTVSSALGQVEAVIGVEGPNSVVGTLEYFIKSPDSNGGGHVQTANKGGTGLTTYTKGDLLVATSSSVLAKLAVSSTAGEVLSTDPNQPTGMKWSGVVANKVAVTTTSVASSSVIGAPIVLFSASILGSTLGINNAIKWTGILRNFTNDSSQTFTIAVNYGNNVIASVALATNDVGSVMGGIVNGVIAGYGSTSVQVGYVNMFLNTKHATANSAGSGQFMNLVSQSTSSIESSANQDLVITGTWTGGSVNRGSILTGIFTVEKIV